jgi:uncharacterized membrane protein
MRIFFRAAGILALLVGLLWIGQGTGTINWPQSSFMISQTVWAYWGAALAVAGGIAIWLARRR